MNSKRLHSPDDQTILQPLANSQRYLFQFFLFSALSARCSARRLLQYILVGTVHKRATCISVGNGPHMLGNEPHVLGKSKFGIMSHSGVLYVAFGILSHLVLCHVWDCVIWDYVIRNYVAFGVMSFRIMLHSNSCRSRLCRSG